jgi:uncharacterized coiled-coil protein SlyX
MQKYKMWCTASHGHQMMKANADEFGYYLMFDVDDRITDLESKAVAQALRIRELEKALLELVHAVIDADNREDEGLSRNAPEMKEANSALMVR